MFLNKTFHFAGKKSIIDHIYRVQSAKIHNNIRIGNRDWVGYGTNGCATYFDSVAFPMPAIRFRENTNDLMALREKEKGDWRKLNLEERKILYRASFCQTFAEIQAPTGDWKYITGGTLMGLACSLFIFTLIKLFCGPPLPESFSEENRAKNLRQIIDFEYGVANGIASKWDYEKNDWK